MNTVRLFISNTFKRLRVFSRLDIIATSSLRRKSELGGWASVYVYPKNMVHISKNASIVIDNGLLTISKPWFEVAKTEPCRFGMQRASKLICNGNFDFVRGCQCVVKDGAALCLGNDGRVGAGSIIECSHSISIGNGCWISEDVVVRDVDENGAKCSIVIEDGVWIGKGATIMGNVRIGKNTVIGEGVKVMISVQEDQVLTVE